MTDVSNPISLLNKLSDYRVDKVLKVSDGETTELVFFRGVEDSEFGPFIRKRIDDTLGMGSLYEELYEAQRAGARFHYVPKIYACKKDETELVVIMERVPGNSLQTLIPDNGSFDLTRKVFPSLCDAVSELHTWSYRPLIHRDLKPSNIMVSNLGVCLIDFGIARFYDPSSSADTTSFGTRGYAPPEQFGFEQTGITSDVYALGIILYELLTGSLPLSANRNQGFSHPFIPEVYRAVIAKACAFSPADRYQTAEELKRAYLEAAFAHTSCSELFKEPVQAPSGHPISLGIAVKGGSYDHPFCEAEMGDVGTSAPTTESSPRKVSDVSKSSCMKSKDEQEAEDSILPKCAPVAVERDGLIEPHDASRISSRLERFIERKDAFFTQSKGMGRIFHILGLVWDCLLIMSAVVMFIATIGLTFDPYPSSAYSTASFSMRLVAHLTMYCSIILTFLYVISYKRPLIRAFPRLFSIPWKSRLLFVFIVFFAGVLIVGFLSPSPSN